MTELTQKHKSTVKEQKITGITEDSRQVKPGYCFVAISGTKVDGHLFIADALQRGAVAIVVERDLSPDIHIPEDVAVYKVENTRSALGRLSHIFYGQPARKCTVIGVTGTNGKTTTTYLLESILRAGGKEPGVIGTINYRCQGFCHLAKQTTPSASELARIIRQMRNQAHIDSLILEVSSHGIDQRRIEGLKFQVGVFTNLTQDHLDYHHTFENYRRTKWRFFTDYVAKNPDATAVFNIDDPTGLKFFNEYSGNKISYAIENPEAHITAKQWKFELSGTQLDASVFGRLIDVSYNLIGRFNIYNVLGAVGVGWALGFSMDEIVKGLGALKGVPGRLENVSCGQPYVAMVDYSHTPDALEQALLSLRPLTSGRLITVFGCGGDRDREKRPMMGSVAARHSDFIVITSDNPRSENPLTIIQDAEQGVVQAGFPPENYILIPDRREAIFYAVNEARENDVILVAGKGHEDYQIIGDKRVRFDDRQTLREAILSRHSSKVCA